MNLHYPLLVLLSFSDSSVAPDNTLIPQPLCVLLLHEVKHEKRRDTFSSFILSICSQDNIVVTVLPTPYITGYLLTKFVISNMIHWISPFPSVR